LALNLSLWPTAAASLVGGILIIVSYPIKESDRPKSFTHGTVLRFSGFVVCELGLIPGPSLGHFYAGERLAPWLMTIGRSLFSGLFDAGMSFVLSYQMCGTGDFPCEDVKHAARDRNAGISMEVIGGVGLLALTVIDLATVKKHAARAQGAAHKGHAAILPLIDKGFGGLLFASEF